MPQVGAEWLKSLDASTRFVAANLLGRHRLVFTTRYIFHTIVYRISRGRRPKLLVLIQGVLASMWTQHSSPSQLVQPLPELLSFPTTSPLMASLAAPLAITSKSRGVSEGALYVRHRMIQSPTRETNPINGETSVALGMRARVRCFTQLGSCQAASTMGQCPRNKSE